MADLVFGIRITADGKVAVSEAKAVGGAFRGIAADVKEAGGAFQTFKGVLGALGVAQIASEIARATRQAITQTIDYAAALDDLSESTGSTVEDLSSLQNQFRISAGDRGAGLLEGALSRLSTRLAATDDDSKRAGAAMRLLGIEARDPATALRELAVRLDEYEDGANKAALVNEIFGRGASTTLLPVLKDIAREQQAVSTVTAQQAAEAEKLQKAWNALAVEGQAFLNSAILPIVAGLNDYITVFRQARDAGLGFFKADQLAAASQEQLAARRVELLEQIEKTQLRLANYAPNALGDWLSEGQRKRLEEYRKELELIARLTGGYGSGPGESTDRIRQQVAPTLPSRAPRNKKEDDDYKTFLSEVNALLREQSAAIKVVARDQSELDRAMAATGRTLESNADAIAKWTTDGNRLVASATLAVKAYEDQTAAIGATVERLAELEIARAGEQRDLLATQVGLEKANEIYERHVAAILARRDKNIAIEQADANARMVEDNARAAEQMADDIVGALSGGFRGVADYAKNLFANLVLRPIVQAAVAPIAGAVSGAIGGGGGGFGGFGSLLTGGVGSGGLGGFGGILGGLGDAIFGAGGASAFGAGFSAPLATLGTVGSTLLSGGTFAAGGAALASTIGAAVPIIGIGLAIASALGAFEKSVPKTGGSGGAAFNLAGGSWATSERLFTPNTNDREIQALVEDVGVAFRRTAETLGAATSGYAEFLLGYDAHEEHGNRVSAVARFNGEQLYEARDVSVGDDQEDIQAGLELEAKRVVLSALQASDLPKQIAAVLDSIVVETATAEEIDNAIAFGAAMRTVMDALEGSIAEDAAQAIEESQRSVVANLRAMGEELARLAGEQDGSVESMQALAQATVGYRQAVTETLVAIEQVQASLLEMTANSREQIEFAGLTDDEAYRLYQERAAAISQQISAADDPAVVGQLAGKFNEYFLAAFNSLSPEEQLAAKPAFLAQLDVLDEQVGSALDRIGARIEEDTKAPLEAVANSLNNAGPLFIDAAGGMQDAASTMSDAALTMATAVANFASTPINVNVGGAEPSLVNA